MSRHIAWPAALLLLVAVGGLVGQPAGAEGTKQLLFCSGRDGEGQLRLYSMDENGANQKAITQGPGFAFDPAFSPVGKKFVFAYAGSKEEKKSDICVINADGTGKTTLTAAANFCFAPSWSPDGKRIVYTTMDPPAENAGGPPAMKMRLMDADGKNDVELGEGWASGWTPDGQRLVYTLLRPQNEEFTINTVEVGGANPQQLVGSKSALATFSPDGKKIAYLAEGGSNNPDLFIADADGKNAKQLTQTEDMEFSTAWSSDGKRIFFTRMPKDGTEGPKKMEIHSISVDGAATEQLTTNDAMDAMAGGFAIFGLLRS